MTLTPQTRVLLTDALRPPTGYRVDIAVGTTYSMDLTALLLAPMAFALFEYEGGEPGTADSVRLLEALRRHSEHTIVFCQAGGIHVPSRYSQVLTLIEDSVVEVVPPLGGALFHPKVWAIRFVDPEGAYLHRVVVLSRNLTFDRSWDTALVLDQDQSGTIPAAPASGFVRRLPDLALREVDPIRHAQVTDLADTLAVVSLAPPSPFTEGELLPMLGETPTWPFPNQATRMLAISPFLTKNTLASLGKVCPDRALVSRPESLDLLGTDAVEGWEVNVLQREAEVDPRLDLTDSAPALNEFTGTNEGLHAKTFVLDLSGSRSMTITGSANLTSQAWNRNVEFDAVLMGPTRTCGVEAILDGPADAPGLSATLTRYTASSPEGTPNPHIAMSWEIEEYHRTLALSRPSIIVERIDADLARATLVLELGPDAPGATMVWPATLSASVYGRTLENGLSWDISPLHVTPFLAVETTAGNGDSACTRQCVLKAELTGDVDKRQEDVLASILRTKADVLRYLAFLLGDPSYDALGAELAGATGGGPAHDWRVGADARIAVFEPLVRAVGRDEEALARVARLIDDLRRLPDAENRMPDGLEDLWDTIWQAHQESVR